MSDTIKGGQGVASRATKDQHDKEAFAAELSRGVQVTPEDQSRSTLHTGEQQEGAYIAKKNVEGADSGSDSGTNPSAASPAQSPQSSGSDPRGLAQTGQSADYQQPAAPDAPNPDSTGPSPTGGEDAVAFRTASTAPNTSAKIAPDGREPTPSPTGDPGLDGVKTPNTDGTHPTSTGGEPAPVDPATENGNALKGMPIQVFQQQDHEAHVRAHIAFLSTPAGQANPQTFIMLQAHTQEHIGMMARDQVVKFFEESIKAAQLAGQPVPQLNPDAVEAAIAQQVGEILKEVMPSLQPQQQTDPLVEIRKKELENDTAELQRKSMNDQMSFQIDQAKLQQAYDLAQQRQSLQENIADDRNDVNIYRINMAANRANKPK